MKFTLTISRRSNDKVYFEVRDRLSRIKFLELECSLEEYARLVTGLSEVEVEGSVKGLENVGKTKVVESRSRLLPRSIESHSPRSEVQDWIKKNYPEDGWTLDLYLGSKNSFQQTPEGKWVNYTVFKYE